MAVQTIDELFNWSDITTDKQPRSKPLTQRGGDVFFVLHHAFNRKVQDTIALSKPGGRTVSMSSAIGPSVAGAQVPIFNVQVVDWNTHRPWTTASSIDDKAYTAEVSNLDLNAPYPVAMEAKRILARIAAALHVQTGMPLDTWHILDHSTVYARGWGSYPTACCGEDLRAAINWIIVEAKRIVAAGGTAEKEDVVIAYEKSDKFIGKPSRTLKAGAGIYLHTEVDKPGAAENIIGAVGQYSITGHVYAEGQPGDVIELLTVWQVNGTNSNHYQERLTLDRDGKIKANVEWKNEALPDNRTSVFLRVQADPGNKADVKITHLSSDAFNWKAA